MSLARSLPGHATLHQIRLQQGLRTHTSDLIILQQRNKVSQTRKVGTRAMAAAMMLNTMPWASSVSTSMTSKKNDTNHKTLAHVNSQNLSLYRVAFLSASAHLSRDLLQINWARVCRSKACEGENQGCWCKMMLVTKLHRARTHCAFRKCPRRKLVRRTIYVKSNCLGYAINADCQHAY